MTARSEAILRQAGGLPEALRRLAAYAEAGADVLYAPMLRTAEEVAEVVRVAGKLPVNVLVGWPGFTKRELEDLGVKRISVGARSARAAALRAALGPAARLATGLRAEDDSPGAAIGSGFDAASRGISILPNFRARRQKSRVRKPIGRSRARGL